MFVEAVSYPAALTAGLLSFFSPCIVPLIPAYFSFITGYSLEQLTAADNRQVRMKVVASTLAYVLGFSSVFVMMGASASYLGNVVADYSGIIRVAGGAVIFILGLHLSGAVRIAGLDFEKRLHVEKKPVRFAGTFVVGMAFGAGWSPCIGPLLGSILIMAGNQDSIAEGVVLLSVYAAGLALPFMVISVFVNYMLLWIRKISPALKYINAAAGVLLMLMGVLLIADKLRFFGLSG